MNRYSILSYRADPTGVEDSTKAINDASSAAAGDEQGGYVYYPPGVYKVSAPKRTKYRFSFPGWTGGTYTLGFGPDVTEALPFDALPGAVADALNALHSLLGSGVRVTQRGSQEYLIELPDSVLTDKQWGLTVDGSKLEPAPSPPDIQLILVPDSSDPTPNAQYNGPMIRLLANVPHTGDLAPDGSPLATLKVADYQGEYPAIMGPEQFDFDTPNVSVNGLAFDFNVAKNPATYTMAQGLNDNYAFRVGVAATGGGGIRVTNCLFAPADTYNCVSLFSTLSDRSPTRITGALIEGCVIRDVGSSTFYHDTSFIRIYADDCLVRNNSVSGNFTKTGVVAAYEIRGKDNLFLYNYAEKCQFGLQLVGTGEHGSGQTCTGNTFLDVLVGFQLWPAFDSDDPSQQMDNTTITQNFITVNELAWTGDPRLHLDPYYYRGVIDVLSLDRWYEDGMLVRDGVDMTGLAITNNVIVFTNADPLAGTPLSAFRFVKGGETPCTVNDLLLQGNLVSGFDAADVFV
jgi:hypothetical protein